MPNQHNQQQVELIKGKLDKAKSVVIVDYAGTSVNDQVQLRRAVTQSGGEILVTKNTLIDIAAGKGKLSDSLTGMNAIVFSYEDEVAAIKAVVGFHDEKEKLEIKQGLIADKVLSANEVTELSKLPNKQQLVANLLSVLQGPARNLVGVLTAGPRNLVYALKAIADKQPAN